MAYFPLRSVNARLWVCKHKHLPLLHPWPNRWPLVRTCGLMTVGVKCVCLHVCVCVRRRNRARKGQYVSISWCVSASVCVCVCLCVASGRRWLVPGLVILSPTHSLMWFEAAAFTVEGDRHRTHSHCSHMSVETHIAHWYAVTFSEMPTHIPSKRTSVRTHACGSALKRCNKTTPGLPKRLNGHRSAFID